jgi:hypothetical protein
MASLQKPVISMVLICRLSLIWDLGEPLFFELGESMKGTTPKQNGNRQHVFFWRFLRFMLGAEPPCRWQDCYFFKSLEEINILPSAWRLRARHESQKDHRDSV